MPYYLATGDLSEALRFDTLKDAAQCFKADAEELARYDQRHEATVHIAESRATLQEYPDYCLSLGPRGGLKIERT